MSFSFKSWLGRPQSARYSRMPFRARLAIETLEDRTVPSTVQGVMFDDANRNGVADGGEPGLAGCTVFLDVNRDGVLNVGETSTVTDANGTYLFDTTNETPAVVGATTGHLFDFVAIALPDGLGAGGRWMNTTATFAIVDRTSEPVAQRNFGAYFRSFAGAGMQPVGTETLANVATAGVQSNTVVAADAAGNYVVAWRTTNTDGTGTILARVFNANGTPRTSELVVATATGVPKVAMSGDGDRIVVAWSNYNATTNSKSTSYRVYSGAGTAVTGAVLIGGGTATSSIYLNGVAVSATGDSVVLYRTSTFNKRWGWSGPTLTAQRYTAAGSANGSAISVVSTTLIGGAASIAMDGTGNFVAVWDDTTSNGGSTVKFQRYDAAGRKAGGLITVASGGSAGGNAVKASSVAMNASGRFVVTYVYGQQSLLAQVYNSNGTAAGAVVQVATGNFGSGEPAGVAIDAAGNATFTWTENLQPGTAMNSYPSGEVHVRRLSATGAMSEDLIVNTTTAGRQSGSAVAATGNGTFVVVWEGSGLGDDSGIFTQLYQPA